MLHTRDTFIEEESCDLGLKFPDGKTTVSIRKGARVYVFSANESSVLERQLCTLLGSRWNFFSFFPFFLNCVGRNHVGTVSRDVRVCTVKFVWAIFLFLFFFFLFFRRRIPSWPLSISLSSRDFQANTTFCPSGTAEIVDIDAVLHRRSVPKVGQFPRRRLFSSLIVRRILPGCFLMDMTNVQRSYVNK